MQFQVVTDKRMPKIRAGRSIISFFYRKEMERIAEAIVPHKTGTGTMKISSPELTARFTPLWPCHRHYRQQSHRVG